MSEFVFRIAIECTGDNPIDRVILSINDPVPYKTRDELIEFFDDLVMEYSKNISSKVIGYSRIGN